MFTGFVQNCFTKCG